jgi:hypothetical protein
VADAAKDPVGKDAVDKDAVDKAAVDSATAVMRPARITRCPGRRRPN